MSNEQLPVPDMIPDAPVPASPPTPEKSVDPAEVAKSDAEKKVQALKELKEIAVPAHGHDQDEKKPTIVERVLLANPVSFGISSMATISIVGLFNRAINLINLGINKLSGGGGAPKSAPKKPKSDDSHGGHH